MPGTDGEERESALVLPADAHLLGDLVTEHQAALVVLDAATSTIDSKLDGDRDRQMRQGLEAIGRDIGPASAPGPGAPRPAAGRRRTSRTGRGGRARRGRGRSGGTGACRAPPPTRAPGRRRAPRSWRSDPAGWRRRPAARRSGGCAGRRAGGGCDLRASASAAGQRRRACRCARSRRPCRCAAGGAGRAENGVATNASASAAASSRLCMRAPMADDLGVVVLAAQLRGLDAPGQRAPDARDLVRRDLLAVAGAADHDAEAAGVVEDGLRRGDAVRRVVVGGVVGRRVRRRPARGPDWPGGRSGGP